MIMMILMAKQKTQRDYMHELQCCKYEGTMQRYRKKHELTTGKTSRRKSIAKKEGPEQEYKIQAWSTPASQPAS
jgi:hypothetical protein